MEEKKFDINSFIGFVLLGAIALWYFYTNQPTPEELAKQKTERIQDSIQQSEQKLQENNPPEETSITTINPTDSVAIINAQNELGVFSYSATLPSAKANETTIENELLKIKVSNKGGQITQVELKNYKTHDSLPLYLINNQNATFNINFGTTDNRILNTKDLFFEPTLSQNGDNQVLSMKLKVANSNYLEYRYEIKPNDHMIDFAIKSEGMDRAINTSQTLNLHWDLKAYRQEKSLRTENMYSQFYYKAQDDVSYLSLSDDDETEKDIDWVAFKQHFFSTVLMSDTPFSTANIISKDLVKDEDIDTVYTKQFVINAPLEMINGELNYDMNMYFGPTDFKTLKKYKGTDLNEVADLGWGIFGWINRLIFVPVFAFLSSFIGNYGLVIILLTIVVRIIMSPVVYKSYLSSAKMKVLRPEMNEINEKYKGKENAMKRQQETMALQRKAGVSPLSGCIPALIQMPVFFALFRFFPSNITLRQKGFLWANDLSSYDAIAKLPFKIPFYGDHVSLFPILASVAIFFYMRMTQSQQMNMQQPAQEGMPDMGKMMKMMMYFSPVMMLFFFNNYASSLSLYYFVSNLLTIIIMLVIKHYILDEDKIHAQIQENKAKPEKKKSKFRARIDDAMKQAQVQQETKKRKKK